MEEPEWKVIQYIVLKWGPDVLRGWGIRDKSFVLDLLIEWLESETIEDPEGIATETIDFEWEKVII